jgi:polar amino acid transport system substrate-binding protein
MNRATIAALVGAFLLAPPLHGAPIGPSSNTAPAVLKLTSLEWPPYTGSKLAGQGATAAVVRAALAAMGHRVDIAFYPWNRATALIRGRSEAVAYFPEYRSQQAGTEFLLSDPIGEGPLGFAEHADAPVRWENLDDLARYQVGVVVGYANADGFDERVRQGRQQVDQASSDRRNLIKLAARRVPLALIDKRVFDYLIVHDAEVAAVAPKLRFNARVLESKQLYLCFRRGPEGERLRRLFNAGLKKIDVDAVFAAALKELAGARRSPATVAR